MKPLSIEELKALEVGDWVWVVDKVINLAHYRQKLSHDTTHCLFERCTNNLALNIFRWDTYGVGWLAYKNKEQAEAKGEIVELPCIREVFKKNKPTYRVFFLRDDNFIDSYTEWTEEEAERRLAKLRGENYVATPQMIAEGDCNGICKDCEGKDVCWKEKIE